MLLTMIKKTTMINQTLYRAVKIEQHKLNKKTSYKLMCSRREAFIGPPVASVVLHLNKIKMP